MNSCRLFGRRWMRFNLKTFMVVVAALAIGLGRLGTEVNRATKHRDAINLLAAHSADVEVAARAWPKFGTSFMPHLDDWLRQRLGDEYLDTIVGVDLCIGTMTDDDLKSIARHPGLSSIERLRLDSQYVTNEGVANLKAFQRLKTLKLVNVKVDDEGLHFLSNLPNLQRLQLPQRVRGRGLRHLADPDRLLSLDMAHAWVEGASLAPLRKCLNLRWLNLQNTRADNSSLRHLDDLFKLQYLNADETRITDAGLQHLARLESLKYLSLNGTNVTDNGMGHLSGLDNLETICLAGTVVRESGLQHLAGLRNFKSVHFINHRHRGSAPPLPNFSAKRPEVLVLPLRTVRRHWALPVVPQF